MNESLGFRYERNQYFNGKLLTAQDFKVEQQYFNSKRSLLNKFLFGSGIVCGLEVTPTSDKSVTIDPGFAIDSLGREIVVDALTTFNLSSLSGFPAGEYYGALYLYIEYDEKDKDQVYSIEESKKSNLFNRTMEGYKLSLSKTPPDRSKNGIPGLMEDIRMVYAGDSLIVWHKAPRYTNPGEVFEASFIFEKIKPASRLYFEYNISSENSEPFGTDSKKLVFTEPEKSNDTEYELKYCMKASETGGSACKISLLKEKMKIMLGDKEFIITDDSAVEIKLITIPVDEQLVKDYFSLSLNKYMGMNTDKSIALAKINIIQASSAVGTTYYIDKVERASFTQYIFNTPLLSLLYKSNSENRKALHNIIECTVKEQVVTEAKNNNSSCQKNVDNPVIPPAVPTDTQKVVTGVVEFPVEPNCKKNYYSDEIIHGLGLGAVCIRMGVEESNTNVVSKVVNNDTQIYTGFSEIFYKSPYASFLPDVYTGAIVYPKKGTFRIGIGVYSSSRIDRIRIRWWAFKGTEIGSNVTEDLGVKNASITFNQEFPGVKVNGKFQLSVSLTGLTEKSLIWTVNEPGGGSVDENGLYTAPGKKGVFSVTVKSKSHTEVKATVYIIVG